LRVHTNENIGFDVFLYGIFDKIVPEAIARLIEEGDYAIEVGANIGQNCSLMAARVGPGGRVLAFEPHPEIFRELQENVALWSKLKMAPLQLENVALGRAEGEAWLANGTEFHRNRGSASLCGEKQGGEGSFKVPVRRLDDYMKQIPKVGVCKIDVEGYELAVLEGAAETLTRGAIRDIIFEDVNPQPSAVARLLSSHGFHLFQLREQWLKPGLVALEQAPTSPRGFSYNYLATREPTRAVRRFRTPGWFCLLNV